MDVTESCSQKNATIDLLGENHKLVVVRINKSNIAFNLVTKIVRKQLRQHNNTLPKNKSNSHIQFKTETCQLTTKTNSTMDSLNGHGTQHIWSCTAVINHSRVCPNQLMGLNPKELFMKYTA